MDRIKPQDFFSDEEKAKEALRLIQLIEQHKKQKLTYADAPKLISMFVETEKGRKFNTFEKQGAISKSYIPEKDAFKFLRTIDKKSKDFSKKYIERDEIKSKFDNSIFQPKEQFLFGEKD